MSERVDTYKCRCKARVTVTRDTAAQAAIPAIMHDPNIREPLPRIDCRWWDKWIGAVRAGTAQQSASALLAELARV